MPRALAAARNVLRFALLAALPPCAPAAPVSAPCVLHAAEGAASADAPLALSAAQPAALASWDVHSWQRHRVWITLTLKNGDDAPAVVASQLMLDGTVPLSGRPVTLAPHASASERLSIWLPDDARTLGVGAALYATAAGSAVSVAFAHDCSDARFDAGTLTVRAATDLREAVTLYLDAVADAVPDPRGAADIARRLGSGAQDATDVAWAVRGMMRALHDESGFIAAPGESVPAPTPRVARAPTFDWLADGIAVVHLHGGDGVSADAGRTLAAAVHDGVAALGARHPLGWIVDLRGNGGDDPWPSLAGLSTLLAGPTVGATVGRAGRQDWIVDRGAVRLAGESAMIDLQSTPEPGFPGPVAVLVDASTSNEGEVVAVAFQERPDARFFGAATAGCASWCVRTHALADGTMLGVVEVRPADRNGRVQHEPVTPDELTDASATPADVPHQAIQWVLEQHRRLSLDR